MRVVIATDIRVGLFKNEFYLASQAYTIFERYSNVLGSVILLARVEKLFEIPIGYKKAQFVSSVVEVSSLMKELTGFQSASNKIGDVDLIIGRLPSIIAYRAFDYAKKKKIKYLAELMCDGWDSYWSHSFRGKLIAPYMDAKMRRITKKADYAIYVTEDYLQKKYPCHCPNINASNVAIEPTEDMFLEKKYENIKKLDKSRISLMTTADVDNKSKGHEYVIKAIRLLKEKGIDATYYMAGGGNQDYLKCVASKNNVRENIVFLGRLTMDQVFQKLDEVDIYIQPSLQEGLPRAVIEAMSRGCFCIGTRTAGTPELISDEYIVERKDPKDIANIIEKYLGLDSATRIEQARINYEKSKKYRPAILDERRNAFLNSIIFDIGTKT